MILPLLFVSIGPLDSFNALLHFIIHSAFSLFSHFPGQLFNQVLFHCKGHWAIETIDVLLVIRLKHILLTFRDHQLNCVVICSHCFDVILDVFNYWVVLDVEECQAKDHSYKTENAWDLAQLLVFFLRYLEWFNTRKLDKELRELVKAFRIFWVLITQNCFCKRKKLLFKLIIYLDVNVTLGFS